MIALDDSQSIALAVRLRRNMDQLIEISAKMKSLGHDDVRKEVDAVIRSLANTISEILDIDIEPRKTA